MRTRRIAEQAQRQIRVRGAVAALAVRHDLAVRRHAGLLVHRAQLGGRLERAVGPEVARPFEVHRAGNRAAARRAHGRAAVLAVAARVEDARVAGWPRRVVHVLPGRDALRASACPVHVVRRRRAPRATAEDPRASTRRTPPSSTRTCGMAEVLEKPECPRRAHAGLLVVDHDRRRRADAARRQQVLDDPQERLERRRVGVDEADARRGRGARRRGCARRRTLGRPEVEEQAGGARLTDDARQFLAARSVSWAFGYPFIQGIVQHTWFSAQSSGSAVTRSTVHGYVSNA